MFASFGAHTKLTNIPFEENIIFEFVLNISFDLPGRLQTAFELKIDLPTSKNQPDAAILVLHALNLLKRPKTSKYAFENFQKIQKF